MFSPPAQALSNPKESNALGEEGNTSFPSPVTSYLLTSKQLTSTCARKILSFLKGLFLLTEYLELNLNAIGHRNNKNGLLLRRT